ncbi:MAG TPA: OsmC family protein [Anaerolineae bacterium]|nr:OsmC family protein [Anaerolineae bacterium]HID84841.1 OsmC family peroxiredoxin [Anaerolineales bacterium]HIQ08810.1 OsmC family peroxiredoxin [Anaerolineaceae bacterium]
MAGEWIKVQADWVEGTNFVATNEAGGRVVVGQVQGEKGIPPMQLLLVGLAGCTGVDVALILQKKRADLRGLRVEVKGTRRDEHPRVYTRIHIHYILWGDLKAKDVEQAIQLSEEKYCSASAMLGAVTEITHDYEIRPAEEAPASQG